MIVQVLSASAGTGKTHRLTKELESRLVCERVRPEGVVAITYTRKAAAELESRIRAALLAAGKPALAARVRDGYIGTVHAVCQRLLRELALEVGLSPYLEPIPAGHEGHLFRRALGRVMGGREHELNRLAKALAIDDWRPALEAIVQRARENGMGAGELSRSAAESRATLLGLLPPTRALVADYRAELEEQLRAVVPVLESQSTDDNKAAKERARLARSVLRAMQQRRLPSWNDQVGLAAKLEVKKLAGVVGPLCDLIASHTSCDVFHEQMLGMQAALFDLAAAALDTFTREKQASRLVDFGDMLALAKEALEHSGVAAALRERLDIVCVDEFQDTNPMQLAVITALASIAKETLWVGDRKQAIFGFQGSDPELMTAAMSRATGGRAPEMLDSCWRSRPCLVDFVSDLFVAALHPHGFAADEVRTTAVHTDLPEMALEPGLECWSYAAEKVNVGGTPVTPSEGHAIAEGVAALLANPPIVRQGRPRGGFSPRRATAKDIAVLAFTNSACRNIAAALSGRGVAARISLGGLAQTAEAVLLRAALGLLADPDDGVAAMEVSYLGGRAAQDPDAWLSAWLERRAAHAADGDTATPRPAPFDDDPRVAVIKALHVRIAPLSPAEAFDLVLREADVATLLRSWPDPEQRLANVEALRGEARAYEELCRVTRSPATVLGLVQHLAEERDPETDRQALPNVKDAVTVSTYHSAKGLEWPVVVLAQLDRKKDRDVFDTEVVPATVFDACAPLAGRWVRHWPWPYGSKRKNIRLLDAARASDAGARVRDQSEREHLRLMYVAFTRARDLLVVAAGTKKSSPKTTALDAIVDRAGQCLLSIPFDSEEPVASIRLGTRQYHCRVRHLTGLPATETPASLHVTRPWYAGRPAISRVPELLNPSKEHAAAGAARPAFKVVRYAPRPDLRVSAAEMTALGDAAHAFFAADVDASAARRRRVAERLLASFGLAGTIDPRTLLASADAMRAYLDETYPSAQWYREWPVRARLQVAGYDRLLVGEIDLLLELTDRIVIVDYKSFPGTAAQLNERIPAYAAQVALYAMAAHRATGKQAEATLCMWVRGEAIHLGPQPVAELGLAAGSR